VATATKGGWWPVALTWTLWLDTAFERRASMSSHHQLSAGVTAGRTRSARPDREGLVRRHRWTLATSASVGTAGYLLVRFLLAGAPIAESLGAASVIALALFLYCAVIFRALDARGPGAG
jgi:hypothetical protein